MVDTDDTLRTTDDERWTTLQVWHKLPTGELKKLFIIITSNKYVAIFCLTSLRT